MTTPAIKSIYEIFKSAFGDKMWGEDTFRKVFDDSKCVLIDDGALLYREVLGEIEILNIAVKPTSQKQGIGSKLITQMFNENKNIDNYFLEVAIDNNPAINLYKKNGFEVVGTREKYYNNKTDAYTMRFKP
ncbi:MAG: ribosomal protein S18-alanine N-acetyltransferase [Alphaproteobacteria bacterium]